MRRCSGGGIGRHAGLWDSDLSAGLLCIDSLQYMKTKRSREEFEAAAKSSFIIAGMCRYLGLKPCGGNYKLMHNAIIAYNIDISHFRGQGWNVGLKFRPNKARNLSEILINGSTFQSFKLKNRLFKDHLKEKKCECCGQTKWMGYDIPLEIHHKNGDNRDNRLENLAILCPNCHALTDSYRGRNNKSASKETLKVELP